MPETGIPAVGRAYEARILNAQVWAVEGVWNGHRAVIARIGAAHVLGTASGYRVVVPVPRGIRRPRGLQWPLQRDQLQSKFQDAGDYIKRIADACPSPTFKIHLSSFGAWAREAAAKLARDDLVGAFSAVMTPKESTGLFTGGNAKADRSYQRVRVPFYLRQIGAALRVLRTLMPDQVRTTLWSIGVPDFRLANWLMECETNRLYRCQALKTQPLLLPLALLGEPTSYGDANMAALAHIRLPLAAKSRAQRRETVNARALFDAIDAGKPWFEQLEHVLADLSRRHHCEKPISTANIRWLAGRSPRFLWWTRHGGSNLRNFLDIAISLPGNRQPTNRFAWATFEDFIRRLPATKVNASFLKGMPCNWADEPWPGVALHMSSVCDAIEWVSAGQHSQYHLVTRNAWEWLVQHATLRQVLNFSEAAHAIRAAEESALQREWQDNETEIKWDGALPARVFMHNGLAITELTTAAELDDEGSRLQHCIGNYARLCVIGQSRIFSVRNGDGASLSSLELRRATTPKTRRTRLDLAQHCAYRNRAPTAVCEEAVAAFLRAARLNQVAVNMVWPVGAMPWDRRRIELDSRVREAVTRELFRRWPALRPIVLSPTAQYNTEDSTHACMDH